MESSNLQSPAQSWESPRRNTQCSPTQEYFNSLQSWIYMHKWHTFIGQQMAMMTSYAAWSAPVHWLQQQQASAVGRSSNGGVHNVGVPAETGGVDNARLPQNQVHAQPQQMPNDAAILRNRIFNRQDATQNQNAVPQIPVLEFTLPSIYRRVVAELIDFFLLFSAKLSLMLIIIDYLGISSDTTGFMMRFLVEEIEDDTSLEELQQMLVFAFIYRVIVCMYETFFLCSQVNRILGGATPGKFLMRLRVISLEQVQTVGPGRVQVTLPDSVSFTQSLLRSIVKNFSMAFFFPACITVFFNPHLRAAYEVLTRTMVVGTENWPLTFPAHR